LFRANKTDRRTDMTKIIAAFRRFANAPENVTKCVREGEVSIKHSRCKNTLLKKSVMFRVFSKGCMKSCRQLYLKMETYPISETRCVERQKTDDCPKGTKDVHPQTDDTS